MRPWLLLALPSESQLGILAPHPLPPHPHPTQGSLLRSGWFFLVSNMGYPAVERVHTHLLG